MNDVKATELKAETFIVDDAEYHWYVRKDVRASNPDLAHETVLDIEMVQVWVSQCYVNSNNELVTLAEVYSIPIASDAMVKTYNRDEMAALLRA